MKPPLRIILAGNPNVGKTTLFNALTGSRAKVSNYPGVTVDQHIGELQLPTGAAVLVDVPGTYSLVARSPEEFIALRAIAGLDDMPVPDAVVVCLDANQLARSAYLLLQCQELGARCVVALTMVDEQATPPDAAALSARLGCPVVPVIAATGRGLADLRMALATIIESPRQARHRWPHSAALAAALREVGQALPTAWRPYPEAETALALWALQSLDDDDELREVPGELRRVVRQHQGPSANPALDDEPVLARWAWLDRELPSATQRPITRAASRTERLDQVLLHRVGGFALFMAIMTVMFLALFTWSAPFTDGLEALLGQVGTAARATLRPDLFADFVIDGVLGGVGAVLMFLPQILILFFLLGLLEDVGYLARVAYLMDRIMRAMNLHGRAFVPMLSGFACAVPAILATRTLERRRDRLLTMLVIPLMTCSARLPVYTLVITALLPGSALTQGLIMVGLYAFSVVAALLASLIMGRTMKPLKAKRLPFFVELPPYRWPRWRDIVRAMWQRSAMFLREAGTTIFVASVVLWALLAFPRQPLAPDASAEAVAEARATQLQHSYGGQLGHAIEPALAPLGFDWRIGIGLIGSFAAREVFVATLGVAVGSSPDGDDTKALVDTLRDQRTSSGGRAYTPLVAISLLVFFALACQCMSTLAVIKRETQSWRWPLFVFSYMTVLAYLASLAVYQVGRLLGWQ